MLQPGALADYIAVGNHVERIVLGKGLQQLCRPGIGGAGLGHGLEVAFVYLSRAALEAGLREKIHKAGEVQLLFCAGPLLKPRPGPLVAGIVAFQQGRGEGALRGKLAGIHQLEGLGHVSGKVQEGLVSIQEEKADGHINHPFRHIDKRIIPRGPKSVNHFVLPGMGLSKPQR